MSSLPADIIAAVLAGLQAQGYEIQPPASPPKAVPSEDTTKEEIGDESKMEPVIKKPPSRKRARTVTPKAGTRKSTRTTSNVSRLKKEKEMEEVASSDRQVVRELIVDFEFLRTHQLVEVMEALEAQGWSRLFREDSLVDEDCVREFYDKFSVIETDSTLIVTINMKGKTHAFTHLDLSVILGVPAEGYSDYVKGT